jgi:hypothetical protein
MPVKNALIDVKPAVPTRTVDRAYGLVGKSSGKQLANQPLKRVPIEFTESLMKSVHKAIVRVQMMRSDCVAITETAWSLGIRTERRAVNTFRDTSPRWRQKWVGSR